MLDPLKMFRPKSQAKAKKILTDAFEKAYRQGWSDGMKGVRSDAGLKDFIDNFEV